MPWGRATLLATTADSIVEDVVHELVADFLFQLQSDGVNVGCELADDGDTADCRKSRPYDRGDWFTLNFAR